MTEVLFVCDSLKFHATAKFNKFCIKFLTKIFLQTSMPGQAERKVVELESQLLESYCYFIFGCLKVNNLSFNYQGPRAA